MTFDQWCDEIDRIASGTFGYKDEHITVTRGREHFKESYELGDSPFESFATRVIDEYCQ